MALNINGTTGISGVDGSVSAPALTGTDSNTGITFPSADTIKFSTGGVERMSITNSGISGITAGITEAAEWNITTGFSSGTGLTITSNLAQRDYIGSGMSESSGVFTFPSTGMYLINYIVTGYASAFNRYAGGEISATTNNSSYSNIAEGYNNTNNDTNNYFHVSMTCIFDVTNVSTHKVKFLVSAENDVTVSADSSRFISGMNFLRLGDT